MRQVVEGRWGSASPATWNNRLTALGSFRRWILVNGWTRTDLLAGIERRPQPRDDTAAIRYEQLNKLWTGIGLSEFANFNGTSASDSVPKPWRIGHFLANYSGIGQLGILSSAVSQQPAGWDAYSSAPSIPASLMRCLCRPPLEGPVCVARNRDTDIGSGLVSM